eukprot:m.118064 g.118064  ORF g.118064 m.118064 type:complete len:323 (-) comp10963_c1_seq2:125-1093(-)
MVPRRGGGAKDGNRPSSTRTHRACTCTGTCTGTRGCTCTRACTGSRANHHASTTCILPTRPTPRVDHHAVGVAPRATRHRRRRRGSSGSRRCRRRASTSTSTSRSSTIPPVRVSTVVQNGSWFDITQGDQTLIQHQVFSAYMDHGIYSRYGALTHAYMILPGLTSAAAVPAALAAAQQGLTYTNDAREAQSACVTRFNNTDTIVMMASLWYDGASVQATRGGCWNVELTQGIEAQGAMIMLRHRTTAGVLSVSAANPHAIGGTLVFTVSGAYSGPGCVATGTGATASTRISLKVPGNTRTNGQGTSGQTVTTTCMGGPPTRV